MAWGGGPRQIAYAQVSREPSFLLRRQPVRVFGPLRQIKVGNQSQQNCGDSFKQKHLLPAGQTGKTLPIEERAGNRAANDSGNRPGGHKEREDSSARNRGKPSPQIVDDAGDKSRFGGTEKKSKRVEGVRRMNEEHRGRN